MNEILIAIFGKTFAAFALSLPIGWGIIATLLGVALKFWIIPMAIDAWKNKAKKQEDAINVLNEIKDSLVTMTNNDTTLHNSIKEEFLNQRGSFQRISVIEHKCDEILSDSNGTMDETLSMRYFASDLEKRHLQLILFFRLRCKANHIIGNEELIIGRYAREAEKGSNKHINMLFDLSHKGTTLNTFWGSAGALSYFRHIAFELYGIQEQGHEIWQAMDLQKQATSSIHETILKEDDIKSALDRNVSKFISMFKTYLQTGKTFADQHNEYDLKIIQTDSNTDIQML